VVYPNSSQHIKENRGEIELMIHDVLFKCNQIKGIRMDCTQMMENTIMIPWNYYITRVVFILLR
jgi:hypothetical protein